MSQPAALTMKGMASMSAWFTPPRTSRCNASNAFFSLLHAESLQRRSLRKVLDGSEQAREEHSPGRACWALSWMCLLDQRQRKRYSLFAFVVITCSFQAEDPTTADEYPPPVHSSLRLSGARNGPSERVQWYSKHVNGDLTRACSV